MEITRTSPFSGITRTIELDITHEQIADYESGTLLQNAFPNLDANEREFYKTGISSGEWEDTFGQETDN